MKYHVCQTIHTCIYLNIPEYDGINVSISGELISRPFSERERERRNKSFRRKLTVSICTKLLSGSLTDVSFMKFMKIDEIKILMRTYSKLLRTYSETFDRNVSNDRKVNVKFFFSKDFRKVRNVSLKI